jgi:hypothetical protein
LITNSQVVAQLTNQVATTTASLTVPIGSWLIFGDVRVNSGGDANINCSLADQSGSVIDSLSFNQNYEPQQGPQPDERVNLDGGYTAAAESVVSLSCKGPGATAGTTAYGSKVIAVRVGSITQAAMPSP